MLMLLSPAKTLDYETPATTDSFSIPEYLEKSSELVKVLKQKSFLESRRGYPNQIPAGKSCSKLADLL